MTNRQWPWMKNSLALRLVVCLSVLLIKLALITLAVTANSVDDLLRRNLPLNAGCHTNHAELQF